MEFFKEITNEFKLLSKDALERLFENIRQNAKGSKSGVTRTALNKTNLSKESINEKMGVKKKDSKSVLIQHLQELWVNQKGRCFYTGIKMNESYLFTGDQNIEAISVERINNNEGYVVGNLRLVIRGINKMRGSSDESQFIDLLKRTSLSVIDKYQL
jgi:hypothetical protein